MLVNILRSRFRPRWVRRRFARWKTFALFLLCLAWNQLWYVKKCTHTRTNANTHIHAHTPKISYKYKQKHTHAHTHTLSTRAQIRELKNFRFVPTNCGMFSNAHIISYKYNHTHARIHTCTDSRAEKLSLYPSFALHEVNCGMFKAHTQLVTYMHIRTHSLTYSFSHTHTSPQQTCTHARTPTHIRFHITASPYLYIELIYLFVYFRWTCLVSLETKSPLKQERTRT